MTSVHLTNLVKTEIELMDMLYIAIANTLMHRENADELGTLVAKLRMKIVHFIFQILIMWRVGKNKISYNEYMYKNIIIN